jgi:hypothetical protein
MLAAVACNTDDDSGRTQPVDAGSSDPDFGRDAEAEGCPMGEAIEPLGDVCNEAVCHVMLRFDYATRKPLGWRAIGGAKMPVDMDEVITIVKEVLEEHSPNSGFNRSRLVGPEAGLFLFSAAPDFAAFLLIGEQSGLYVAGGGMLHGKAGAFWSAPDAHPGTDISCTTESASPPEHAFIANAPVNCRSNDWLLNDFLEIALRTNLAPSIAAKGPYSAFVYLYAADTSECRQTGEAIVVFTQLRE